MAPRNERVLTLDKNPEQLFKAWQQAGKIPAEYGSWQELESTYMGLVKGGLSEKEARTAMGVTYRNVDGQNLLQINQASDGSTRGLNKRAVRVDLNIGAENHLRNRGGQPAVDQRIREIQQDWNKLSKFEAQQLGVETGKQFHRGHVVAGLEGGSLSNENMWPEHGKRNVLHGKEPRWPVQVIEEMGIPKNDLEAIYERKLQSEGLGMDRVNNALAVAMDERMVQPERLPASNQTVRSPKLTGAETYSRNNAAGMSPEAALATQQKLNQLEAQGVSRQAIENWSRDQSATLSRGDATAKSGPVRTVVAPVKKPVSVSTPGARRTEQRLVPSGSSPAISKPAPKPSIQVGKTPAKPKATPVGQQAVLGGKPVVWNGKSWMPVTAKPAAKSIPKTTARPAAKSVSKPIPRTTAIPKLRPAPTSTSTRPNPRQEGSPLQQLRQITSRVGGIARQANQRNMEWAAERGTMPPLLFAD